MSAAAQTMPTAADVRELLAWISPDAPREDWVRVLMAVKAALGDAGFEIADEWSQRSAKYKPADMRATWRSIRADGGVNAGTLFYMAKAAGWQPSDKTPQEPPQRTQAPVQRALEPPSTFAYAVEISARARREDWRVASHPYAIRKHITHAAGAGRATVSGRLVGKEADCIIVPMRVIPGGQLCGVECINPIGEKQTFGSKGVLVLGNDLDRKLPVLVVEGWATAVHTLNAFRWNACAVVAGGKHRLERVAREIDQLDPTRQIVICNEVDA